MLRALELGTTQLLPVLRRSFLVSPRSFATAKALINCPHPCWPPHQPRNTHNQHRRRQNNQVADEDDGVDDPDLALRLGEGLQESTAGEIKTVVASKADADIYHSASAFEDIISNKDLLTVRCWRGCCCSALARGLC